MNLLVALTLAGIVGFLSSMGAYHLFGPVGQIVTVPLMVVIGLLFSRGLR